MGREGACNHQVCYRVGLTVRIASERLTARRARLTVRSEKICQLALISVCPVTHRYTNPELGCDVLCVTNGYQKQPCFTYNCVFTPSLCKGLRSRSLRPVAFFNRIGAAVAMWSTCSSRTRLCSTMKVEASAMDAIQYVIASASAAPRRPTLWRAAFLASHSVLTVRKLANLQLDLNSLCPRITRIMIWWRMSSSCSCLVGPHTPFG